MSVEDDFKKFNQKIEQALKQLVSNTTLDPISKELANTIKVRTRLGYGVDAPFAPKKQLAKLATSTIESRKRKRKQGKLSDKTTPTKSNLTQSGQMLDSIKGRAINQLIEIGLEGSRNQKIAAYHQAGNSKLPRRPFLSLGKEDLKQLTAEFQDRFSEILNRIFK